jgi:hypothetical protein
MNWLITWSISSNLNFSSLLINSEFRYIITILLWLILSRIIFSVLLRVLLLDWLFIILCLWLNLTIILVSDHSIRYSWDFRFNFLVISINLLIRFINKLSPSIWTLVNNSRILNLILRSIYLLCSLYIAWIAIIIANILLRINLLSKSKEIALNLRLLLLNMLNRLGLLYLLNLLYLLYLWLLVLFNIPLNINTLLDYIVLSRLAILINKSLNIPSQFLIFRIFSHILNQFLFFSLIEISIRFIYLS